MARYIDAEHLIQKINDNRKLSKWAKGIATACVMDTPVVDFGKGEMTITHKYIVENKEDAG